MKRIIKLSLVAVFACVAGYNVYQSQKQVELSGLMLENVEALAGGEGGGGYTKHTGQCPDPVWYKRWVSCERGDSEDCYPSDC